ncbi:MULTISPECIES: hypothetical protein [unclassified Sphingomonas]|uniref:hypothetical protein n=1 Tax=unclassified Sphingomonas TaxID=196159 RepID=UPI0026D7FC70
MSVQVALMPVQWADLKDIEDVDPINSADDECLREIYDVLKRYGKSGRFGINLIHKHFDMNDDEVLLEITDKKERSLVLRPAKRDSAAVQRTVETSWVLSEDGNQKVTAQCYVRCVRNIHGNHENGGHYWA